MRVLILGGDGYLGWPTAMYLSERGFEVDVADNYFRRNACRELGISPLLWPPELDERAGLWRERSGHTVRTAVGDVTDHDFLSACFTGRAFGGETPPPDAVVHYAEQPSAPYSMLDRDAGRFTLVNNLVSTYNLIHCVLEHAPACHLVKLGTMGVYGTPNIDIEEGWLTVDHKGRSETFLYPKSPGSLYHLTKAQDGDMLAFYCRVNDIAVTDLNQGPVYGIMTPQCEGDDRLLTLFNYDDVFGTVLNRFLVQAVAGHPLTVYGKGGQVRGYLNIVDTLQCVELSIKSPAEKGEYRVFNQFVETFTVNDLADKVREAGKAVGLDVVVNHIENPRREAEEHYYKPAHTGLLDLGLTPHLLDKDTLVAMLEFVQRHKGNIDPSRIMPRVKWDGGRGKE